MQSEEIKIPHRFVDFAARLELDGSTALILEDDMKRVGYIKNLNERWYLYFLKEFLIGLEGQQVKRFNFEKNFYTAAIREFEYLIEIIVQNKSIEVLEIGNNVIPLQLMTKLADALVTHANLVELSLRMHWCTTSQENMAFIPILAGVVPKLYKLEKIDFSCHHIDITGLSALVVACEQNIGLLQVDLSGVTYVNMSPTTAYNYWFRINTALAKNRALLAEMANACTPEVPERKTVPAAVKVDSFIKRRWIETSDDELQEVKPKTPQPMQKQSEIGKPVKRRLIELSDEEQASPSLKGSTIHSASFFKLEVQDAAFQRKKTFTQRLSDTGIKIEDQHVFGVKAIELVYYEQIEEKLYVKFMEEPAALFYRHGQHTYQRTYDLGYINRLLRQHKLQKFDPFTRRTFTEHIIEPDPFYKEWLESFVKGLERDNQQRSVSPTLVKIV